MLTIRGLGFFFFMGLMGFGLMAQVNPNSQRTYTSKADNKPCFDCHGGSHYRLTDTTTGDVVRKRMSLFHRIDSSAYYQSNHYDFKCFDCHSDEYSTFPHPLELRFEQIATCLDCHGGDEVYAKFNFEGIDEQVGQSIHSQLTDSGFNCYSCHDSHTYTLSARNESDISKVVRASNNMCLRCHGNQDLYGMYSLNSHPNIIEKHDWLPNQENHFASVRCLDCHAEFSTTTLVAHKILPSDKAQKNCVACHSANSILAASLYRHTKTEERASKGFWSSLFSHENTIDTLIAGDLSQNRFAGTFSNAGTLGQSFIIGANRNKLLNILSVIIFAATVAGIIVHSSLRVVSKKKNQLS